MKTLTTSMLLSVIFLSAGAFAGPGPDRHQAPAPQAAAAGNVTVVLKNGSWPPAGLATVEPCSIHRCIDI